MSSFSHSPTIWADFPGLRAAALTVNGVDDQPWPERDIARFTAVAAARLREGSEGDFPEVQAWRRAFSRMGLKPTQYRCAAEALLRRYRKEGQLPRLHPLVDLSNAASMAYGIPVAAFDRDRIAGDLTVRYATGQESYRTLVGDVEAPAPGEVIFADEEGAAHARRWTNRQSGLSAVRPTTTRVLIVLEALHATGAADTARLAEELRAALQRHWPASSLTAVHLTASEPAAVF